MNWIKTFENFNQPNTLIIVDVQKSFVKFFTEMYINELTKHCQNFNDVVREAGTGGELIRSKEWDTVDGKVARIILCDQLARNCFRGTAQAFAYDR